LIDFFTTVDDESKLFIGDAEVIEATKNIFRQGDCFAV